MQNHNYFFRQFKHRLIALAIIPVLMVTAVTANLINPTPADAASGSCGSGWDHTTSWRKINKHIKTKTYYKTLSNTYEIYCFEVKKYKSNDKTKMRLHVKIVDLIDPLHPHDNICPCVTTYKTAYTKKRSVHTTVDRPEYRSIEVTVKYGKKLYAVSTIIP